MAARGKLFRLIAIGILVLSAGLALSTAVFLAGAVSAEGVVTEARFNGSNITVEFTPVSGPRTSFTQHGWIGSHTVGERVPVLYHRDGAPETARLNVFGGLWGPALLSLVLGAVFLLLGLMQLKAAEEDRE